MSETRGEVASALNVWRESLVGLSGTNKLIQFRPSVSGAPLVDSPTPDEILARIEAGQRWTFHGDEDQDGVTVPAPAHSKLPALHSPRDDSTLGAFLRRLMGRATEAFIERGLSVLYVAYGMLHWQDVDGTKMVSPLLLQPVALHPNGPKGVPDLGHGEDDVVVNPALVLRLREFNVTFPSTEDIDELSVTEVLDLVVESVHDHKGWEVKPTVYLSTFSFEKEAMYRDLLENEALIAEHPIVQALANNDPTSQTQEFAFDPIDPDQIDVLAPPEKVPLVLDADSSQRAAVAAAVDGRTFVMDGPPGTGKSQTIANMIGALLHAGKTVLFVSEKMAALDVVRNRLADAGLGNFLLEVHSAKSSRREVAAELLRALDTETVPPAGMNVLTRSEAADRRRQLNDYAAAMNEVREPLGVTLNYALGRLAELHGVASAPLPEQAPVNLTQEGFNAIQAATLSLQRAWRPAAQGTTFLWRDAIEEASLDIRLHQAESALVQLRDTAALNREVAESFGFTKPSDVPKLVALVAHWDTGRPREVLDSWLVADDPAHLQKVTDAYEKLREQIREVAEADSEALHAAGVPWERLPAPEDLPSVPAMPFALNEPADQLGLTAAELTASAQEFEQTSQALTEGLAAVTAAARKLGLSSPATFEQAGHVISLAQLRHSHARPDTRWFSEDQLKRAREAAAVLRERISELKTAEETASGTFTADALTAPVAELQDRFEHLHKGLKKLSGGYRTDKKAVAALLTSASTVETGIQRLSDAVAWGKARAAYETAAGEQHHLLGDHWSGLDTNFTTIEEAFEVAAKAIELTDGQVPAPLAQYLADPSGDEETAAAISRAHQDFKTWANSIENDTTVRKPAKLLTLPISMSVDWLDAHVGPMRQNAARVNALDQATGRVNTLGGAEELLAMRERAVDARAAIANDSSMYAELLGAAFKGLDTDAQAMAAIGDALQWARDLCTSAGGMLTRSGLEALERSRVIDELASKYESWRQASERIVAAFSTQRAEEIRAELDGFEQGLEFINELRDDTIGQQEWFAYTAARNALGHLGLDTAVDFCIEERIAESQVPPVVERALLRSWADGIISQDSRLRPLLAKDHDELVDEYRNLDKQLIISAATEIITAANARRPQRSSLGEPAVIRRQGMMKRKHMPVRELIAATRNTCLAIKPCFMMSPLAVSQYLPPDMNFDVVIFDEASQVTPADAINCIYRGNALILAGDDKQLPPTSFFDRLSDDNAEEDTDVADFQSVLELAKGAGAFNNLGLRWHYRSRHEGLIAFSNYKFYEGKLITYPSAHAKGDDVGVAFYYEPDGVYRRGGGADNPKEAEKVAERVIEHFTNRPDLTLGVVTFSVTQRDAVVAAIANARESRRDLDRFFDTGDRLNGFFARSLESVQGDERDVILFSIGYGPDEAGKIGTSFGVLNKEKGWRRLNVAVTRARQRVEVISSVRAGDIPASNNENVEFLRAYLDYAERGPATLALDVASTGLGPESPFEESVIKTITSWGYSVESQVGSAGYRIDMGVRHPAHPGMFAIGVECDGYQYHSAPAARDRDRLREEILQGLGWKLHRIWGTAWYRNRTQEEERLRAAIEAAVNAPIGGRMQSPQTLRRPTVTTVERDADEIPSWTIEYQVSPRQPLPSWVDLGSPSSTQHLAMPLQALAAAEGPVHLDLVNQRIRDWWNVGRVSQRVRDNVMAAIRLASLVHEDGFIDIPERAVEWVRTPTSEVNRKAEQVHLRELQLAAEMLLRDVGRAERGELVVGIARIFGWARTGNNVEQRVNLALDGLLKDGVATDGDGHLTLVAPTGPSGS